MTNLEDGLVLYLPFEEGSGTKTYDKSKHQNNGIISGALFIKPYESDLTDEGDNPIVVYDDDETFWSPYQAGVGSYDITVSEETSEKIKGLSSLKMIVGAGSFSALGVVHDYGVSTQDWNTKDFLSIWFYGVNLGENIDMFLEDSAGKYLYWRFIDNYSGWTRKILLFGRVTGTDGIDLSDVKKIYFYYPSINQGYTSYLDRIVVDVGNWRHGEALDFETDDYVTIADSDSLDLDDEITISCFIKIDSVESAVSILGKGGDTETEPNNYGLFRNIDKVEFNYKDAGNNWHWWVSNSCLQIGQRYHVVISYKSGIGSSIKCYVNGQQISGSWESGDGNSALVINNKPILLGKFDTGFWFNGIIDELRIYNRILSIEEIRTLYNEKAFNLDRGLILDLSMNEGSGTKTYDKSKYQNNGVITGADWVDGKYGKALSFDGVNNRVTASSLNAYPHGKGAITICFWVKFTVASDTKQIVGWWWVQNNKIMTSSSRILIQIQADSMVASITNNALNDGCWHFIVGTYDSSIGANNVKIYCDGVQQTSMGTTTGNMNATGDVFGIGAVGDGSNAFNGIIDEVRIYNRALTSQEIRTLYLKMVS